MWIISFLWWGLAQGATALGGPILDPLASLLNFGAIGAMLAWVLLRLEPRMSSMEKALNRLTQAQMLTLIARADVENPVKEQAKVVLEGARAALSKSEGTDLVL